MRAVVRQAAASMLVVGGLAVGGAAAAGAVQDATSPGAAASRVEAAGPLLEGGSAPDTTPEVLSRAFRRATQQAMPGVVYVEVESTRPGRVEVPDPFEGTPWEDLFRRGEPAPGRRIGNGSGFVFRSDGYVLTNNHVVDGAVRLSVVTQDRREFTARLVGRDPNTDIAVLKIDATGLPVVPLGDSDAVDVGDWVVALGYPLHLGSTATAGIVSAKGRSLGVIGRSPEASAPLEHFIQTDAAINPGNSGGPLVNLRGEVVAVNTAIASPTGYYSGYGFAVPISIARRVADDLMTHGAVRRPKLGVQIETVSPADAEVYGLERPVGVEVTRVEAGGPAAQAGLQLGDVILAVDGEATETGGDLMGTLARRDPGDTVTLDLLRARQRHQVRVRLGAFEPAVRAAAANTRADGTLNERKGFAVADVTPAVARRLGVPSDRGVVITDVEASGPAARAGLRPGQVIETVNGRRVERIGDLEAALRGTGAGQAVSLVVRAPDGSRTIINYRPRE